MIDDNIIQFPVNKERKVTDESFLIETQMYLKNPTLAKVLREQRKIIHAQFNSLLSELPENSDETINVIMTHEQFRIWEFIESNPAVMDYIRAEMNLENNGKGLEEENTASRAVRISGSASIKEDVLRWDYFYTFLFRYPNLREYFLTIFYNLYLPRLNK